MSVVSKSNNIYSPSNSSKTQHYVKETIRYGTFSKSNSRDDVPTIRSSLIMQPNGLPKMIPHRSKNIDCTGAVVNKNGSSNLSNSEYGNSSFQTIFYAQQDLPDVSALPFGLINSFIVPDQITPNDVFKDSLDYIKNGTKTWVNDFIALTNLQISINEDSTLSANWDRISPAINFISENIKNIRSSVAKNAILTAHILGIKTKDEGGKLKIQLLPSLFSAAISEKIVIRKPANDALEDFSRTCRKWSDSPYLWALCVFSRDRNPKICAVAARAINVFVKSLDKDQLPKFDISQFNQYVNAGLAGKLPDTRHNFVEAVEYLLDNKNKNERDKWLKTVSLGTPLYSLVSLRGDEGEKGKTNGGYKGIYDFKRNPFGNLITKTKANVNPMEHNLNGTASVITHTTDPEARSDHDLDVSLNLKNEELESEHESSNWCCDNNIFGGKESCFFPFSKC